MYNTDLPRRADLPSSGRLLRSTIVAALGAAAVLVTIVLPADYGIDPTGAGSALGLTDMGETKARLALEAEADRLATEQIESGQASQTTPAEISNKEIGEQLMAVERSVQELVQATKILAASRAATAQEYAVAPESQISNDGQADSTATETAASAAEETTTALIVEDASTAIFEEQTTTSPAAEEASTDVAAVSETATQPELRSDSVSFTLTPGEGIEVKLVMKEGAQTNFAWATAGGPVNFDTHADGPGGNKISYEKGRSVTEDQGTLVAAFDGNHGWFWRNRGKENVTLTLNTKGYYTEMKGVP